MSDILPEATATARDQEDAVHPESAPAIVIGAAKPYQRLRAWSACHELLLAVYSASQSWPRAEVYGLTAQARRAAFSAAANIAEGSAKRGPREFRRFLDIAVGSLSELSYTLLVARELGFVLPHSWSELEKTRDRANRLTWRLYWAIVRAENGSSGGRR